MGKKLEMVKGGVELLLALGVSTLVGGAIAIVKPAKLGAIKKVAVSAAGLAISSMAIDGVTDYVEKQIDKTVDEVKKIFEKKKPKVEEKTEEVVEVQA